MTKKPPKLIYTLYENPSERFSIKYPEGWEVMESKQEISVGFLSPLESEYDKFHENLTISKPESSFVLDLEQLVDSQIDQLRNNFYGFRLQERKDIKISGSKGIKIIYTGLQQKFRLMLLQIFIVHNLELFLITFTSEENQFLKYQRTVKKMLNSFSIQE